MSRPVKRSFTIKGHRTSVSLEEPFWQLLNEIAANEKMSLSALVAQIDLARSGAGLSSAVRVHILEYVKRQRDTKPVTTSQVDQRGLASSGKIDGDGGSGGGDSCS